MSSPVPPIATEQLSSVATQEQHVSRAEPTVRPSAALLELVAQAGGQDVSRCYQCRKCTNGCPLVLAMDLKPNQVMRAVQLGLQQQVLGSRTIWVCAACQTCTTRCPNDIDIAHVMDVLRQLCVRLGVMPAEPNVVKFHQVFLDSIRRHGRVFELGMIARYKLASGQLTADMKLGWEMFRRGKLKFLPDRIAARKELREMFAETIDRRR